MILDYLMDPSEIPGEFDNLKPLRLVSKGLKKVVDNYEPVWRCFDLEQPLLMPTMCGNVEKIEELLAKGADINKHGEKEDYHWEGWIYPPNPLLLAARYGLLASAKILVEKGADLTPGQKYQDNSDETDTEDPDEDYQESDPMQLAAAHGHIRLMELFLEKGAKIDSKDAKGHTALFAACEKGPKEAALWLIERGANVSVAAESSYVRGKITCLANASNREGWGDVVRAMKEAASAKKAPKKWTAKQATKKGKSTNRKKF